MYSGLDTDVYNLLRLHLKPAIFIEIFRCMSESSAFKYIETQVSERIGSIILNRPDKRNALNFVFIRELKEAFASMEQNPEVKVIILKARGKAFCAGADLEYMQKLQAYSHNENLVDSVHLMELFKQMYRLNKIVIAQIEGHALAGGCGLATLADFSFSVPEAKFGYTEVKIGFIPAIVMVFLIRKIGEGKARELLLTGDLISAHKAHSVGLINDVIPADSIENEVHSFAAKLCSDNSYSSMEVTKKMLADVQNMTLDEGLMFAARMNAHSRGTEECMRGIQNFLNKTPQSW
jgi:methylglutaconyl-CoA hydratase